VIDPETARQAAERWQEVKWYAGAATDAGDALAELVPQLLDRISDLEQGMETTTTIARNAAEALGIAEDSLGVWREKALALESEKAQLLDQLAEVKLDRDDAERGSSHWQRRGAAAERGMLRWQTVVETATDDLREILMDSTLPDLAEAVERVRRLVALEPLQDAEALGERCRQLEAALKVYAESWDVDAIVDVDNPPDIWRDPGACARAALGDPKETNG
jgi:hypothetical protein